MKNLQQQLLRLNITDRHCEACCLPRQQEAMSLVDAGKDIFDRALQMTPETLRAWQKMRSSADNMNIQLQVVSAFRSIEYQCQLIKKKLDKGQSIDQILRVNAIPGYSEHHTGRALDLTTTNCEPLEESFESTEAFLWLMTHAADFGFVLSYPKNNAFGIDYEPWHWAYVDAEHQV